MAEQIQCPHCRRTGFVRREHVISKNSVTEHLYCGACDRTWEEAKAPDTASAARPTRTRRK
jgi:hypothetical protein